MNAAAKIIPLRPTETTVWGEEDLDFRGTVNEDLHFDERGTPGGGSADSSEDLKQLALELRELAGGYSARSQTVTLVIPDRYVEAHTAFAEAMERGAPIALRRPNDVPLHSLLRFGGVLTFVVCTGSVVLWLADLPVLLNPFAAILGIVASPFFYGMGHAARLKQS